MCVCVRVRACISCSVMFDCETLWTVACQTLSMGFLWQEYWSVLPLPPPGDLPDPGIEPASPLSPALQADSLPTAPPGKHADRYTRDEPEMMRLMSEENLSVDLNASRRPCEPMENQ